jgi:hypothetical protein
MKVPQRVIVRTKAPPGVRAKGQDTFISLQNPDGTETPLTNVMALRLFVDARSGYVTAVLVVHDVEIDGVEAEVCDDPLAKARQEAMFWKAEAERLSALHKEPIEAPLGHKTNDYFKKLFPTD